MTRQALIFGATGAVGRELLQLCLDGDRYSEIVVVARRPATLVHAKLCWIECEYDVLDKLDSIPGLAGGDAYCCLGTTIKAAGSEAAFRRVDYDYVVSAARFAKKCGVMHFCMVSALSANAKSNWLYNRTKGEVEAAVIAENFPSLHIFRPSLLKGKRAELRLGEEIGNWVSLLIQPVFYLGLRKYQPVRFEKLARALYNSSSEDRAAGVTRIYENDEIQID